MIVNPIPINNALQMLWIGKCTIREHKQVTDKVTHQTTNKLEIIVEDEPCRLSYSNQPTTTISGGIGQVAQTITLFIRPDIEIKPGSKITVTQHGRTNNYKRASESAVYTNHQEVVVQLDKEV